MRKGSKKNRLILNKLFEKGYICEIINTGESYNVLVNYEVVRNFKQRRSCNKFLEKLNNESIIL